MLVTGASAGIGRTTVKAFAKAGASVAAVARREDQLNAVVEEVRSAGGKAIAVAADISAKGAAQEIVKKVESSLGPVDVLVNNVGIVRLSPLDGEPEDLDIWWRVYEVNVLAPTALVRAVLPSMLKRKSGVLISTTSKVAALALPCMTSYASSKAALTKFHELLTVELDGTGVYNYTVNPGMVQTEFGQPENAMNKSQIEHPAMQKFMAGLQATHKYQQPELAADTMVALAADKKYEVLTGHYIDATQEIAPVLDEANKEGKGRLGSERLYLVNIGQL